MDFPRAESPVVTEILSRANLIDSAEELEQLTSGVLALKAGKMAKTQFGTAIRANVRERARGLLRVLSHRRTIDGARILVGCWSCTAHC